MATTPVRWPTPATSPAAEPSHSRKRVWTWIAAVEVVLAAGAVVLDLGIPTFVVLGLAVLSLAIRRQLPVDHDAADRDAHDADHPEDEQRADGPGREPLTSVRNAAR